MHTPLGRLWMPKTPIHGVRISPEEWDLFSRHAREAGLSVSEFLRTAAHEQIQSTRVHTGGPVPRHQSRIEAKAPRVEIETPRAEVKKAACSFYAPVGTWCKFCGKVHPV